jgi:hypothetical protein
MERKMPLLGTGKALGDKIAAKIIAPNADPQVKKDLTALWESIGDVLVDHIVSNTGVNVNAGIPVSTVGSPTAQTGATTAPGTGGLL